jgi:hypothetical protein
MLSLRGGHSRDLAAWTMLSPRSMNGRLARTADSHRLRK